MEQAQNQINADLQHAADSVVKAPLKSWSLPSLERALLTVMLLAVMVESVGWILGTGTRTFVEVAVPKVTLL